MKRRNRESLDGVAHAFWRGLTLYRFYWRGSHLMVRLTPAWRGAADRWGVFPREWLPHLSKPEFEQMASKFMPPKLSSNGTTVPMADPNFKQLWPLLASWLTDSLWGDGKTRRTPSTLIVCVKAGQFSVGLLNKDSDPESSLWCMGSSLDDALGGLEELLSDPAAPWQVKAVPTGKSFKKGK